MSNKTAYKSNEKADGSEAAERSNEKADKSNEKADGSEAAERSNEKADKSKTANRQTADSTTKINQMVIMTYEQGCIGVQGQVENYSWDMADILRTIQTNYVPSEVDEDGNITHLVQPILLGGDWLSEERVEGIQFKPALGTVTHP
uniref:Uncharacterized protein n=1 Tax=Branchiostoma floridae TaxID=7739 RepID=C4A055_BRAFL|eukprot:XP_002585812.1 hypothetical protein BRAFLDRAFT_111067 [Branchiostoma floridae]